MATLPELMRAFQYPLRWDRSGGWHLPVSRNGETGLRH